MFEPEKHSALDIWHFNLPMFPWELGNIKHFNLHMLHIKNSRGIIWFRGNLKIMLLKNETTYKWLG